MLEMHQLYVNCAMILTRKGPLMCPEDFNENVIRLLSEVYLSQV